MNDLVMNDIAQQIHHNDVQGFVGISIAIILLIFYAIFLHRSGEEDGKPSALKELYRKQTANPYEGMPNDEKAAQFKKDHPVFAPLLDAVVEQIAFEQADIVTQDGITVAFVVTNLNQDRENVKLRILQLLRNNRAIFATEAARNEYAKLLGITIIRVDYPTPIAPVAATPPNEDVIIGFDPDLP